MDLFQGERSRQLRHHDARPEEKTPETQIAVALQDELGQVPTKEDIDRVFLLTRVMYKAVLGLHFKRQEQLPAVADWVAGVGVPAPGSRAVALAIAIIFVPEQIAILPNAMDYANTWKSAVDLYRAIATIK